MPKYEIYQRADNQRRAGHLAILIDGEDAMVSVDPSQFMEKATRELLRDKENKDKKDIAVKAQELSLQMAEHALQRKVEALRRGVLPDGVTLGQGVKSSGVSGYTETQRQRFRRAGDAEAKAVHSFLNRGRLKDRDGTQRKQMLVAPKNDSHAEWLKSRGELIKAREKELKQWETEFQKGNPKAEKYVRSLADEIAALKAPVQNASHGFQYAYTQYWTAAINLVSDDIRIWPLMTNTTLDTLRDAVDTFSDVTADEFDGANYSAGGLALDNQAVAVDDANDRAEFSADDEVVTNLGAGTRSIQGVALGKFNTSTAASLPLHWIEFASVKTPDGSNFTFDFSATDGILQMAG